MATPNDPQARLVTARQIGYAMEHLGRCTGELGIGLSTLEAGGNPGHRLEAATEAAKRAGALLEDLANRFKNGARAVEPTATDE